jgi:hypothetical protein
MAEPHVISALKTNRAELSGELQKFTERSTAIRAHIPVGVSVFISRTPASEPALPVKERTFKPIPHLR